MISARVCVCARARELGEGRKTTGFGMAATLSGRTLRRTHTPHDPANNADRRGREKTHNSAPPSGGTSEREREYSAATDRGERVPDRPAVGTWSAERSTPRLLARARSSSLLLRGHNRFGPPAQQGALSQNGRWGGGGARIHRREKLPD